MTDTATGGRAALRARLYEAYASQHAGIGGDKPVALSYQRDIRPRLPAGRGGRVLDIGCGQGALVRLMRADGYDAEGVDVSPEQVALAHAAGVVQVSQGDYRETLAARPGHYVAVTATDVLEHLSKSEVLDAFDLVADALVPGGVFIARVPNAVSPLGGHTFYGDFTHEARFTSSSVRQLAAAAGFASVTVVACPPVAHGVVSALRRGVWSGVSAWYRLALAAETGTLRGHILTQNLTFMASAPGALAGVSTTRRARPGHVAPDLRAPADMCGVAGAAGRQAERMAALVRGMNEAQSHRSPDHRVVVPLGTVTLGNTRLAVQDPTPAGNQPFCSPDGRFTCVVNGEVYNHRSLTERYSLPVRSGCDAEVIPHLWAKLGTGSLAELRGMFAIALWDAVAERLYLARDPLGIKPLYWRRLGDGTLLFASEVRPLAAVAPRPPVNPGALARFLHLGAMGASQSPFCEIMAVPPNCVVSLAPGGGLTTSQIRLGGPLCAAAGPSDFGAALTGSIEVHLGADVPMAALVSSGVDSAALCAVSRGLGRDLHCLTVATEGAADESAGAARTARHYGHDFQCVPAALRHGDLTRFFATMQRPTIDGLNTYLVARAVHDAGFKVALSGLGGDEAVGGYSHFQLLKALPAMRALRSVPAVPAAAAGLAGQLGLAGSVKAKRMAGRDGPVNGPGLVLLQREVVSAPLVAELTGVVPPRLADVGVPPGWRPRSWAAMTAAEVAIYLQATLLPDADAFSMAHSVELRVPFVDTEVFGAALALDTHSSVPPGKTAIGVALGDTYLRRLAAHRKLGFSLPMADWLTGPLAPVLRAASQPDAPVWSLLDRSAAQRAGLCPLRAQDRWAPTWAVASLNAWLESHGSGSPVYA